MGRIVGGAECARFSHDLQAALDIRLLEPCGLVVSKRLFRRQFGIVSQFPRLICLYALLDLEALDLARRGAGQIVLPDFVAADALCRRDLWRKPSMSKRMTSLALTILRCRSTSKLGTITACSRSRRFARLAFQPHHGNFLDERRLQVVRFDLFRIDILAVAEDDDFFLAPSQKQMALRVEIAEIASEEPSVSHDRGCCIGTIPISLHHDGAADRDFADRRALFLRLRVDDLALDAFHGLAARSRSRCRPEN